MKQRNSNLTDDRLLQRSFPIFKSPFESSLKESFSLSREMAKAETFPFRIRSIPLNDIAFDFHVLQIYRWCYDILPRKCTQSAFPVNAELLCLCVSALWLKNSLFQKVVHLTSIVRTIVQTMRLERIILLSLYVKLINLMKYYVTVETLC